MGLLSLLKVKDTETRYLHVCNSVLTFATSILMSFQHLCQLRCPIPASSKVCHLHWLRKMPARGTTHTESGELWLQYAVDTFWLNLFSVPVYDGWATKDQPVFTFSDNNFSCLLTWPLYKKGEVEIPSDAVVSVGYSIGTYLGKNMLNLLTNVQFVIVFAVPESL